MNWLEKYKPTNFDDIEIQCDVKNKMEEWLLLFQQRKTSNQFMYLYGSPGCGKTTLANLLLKKYHYDILEWNVIDLKQNKNLDETIEKVIKRKNINILIKQKKVYSAVILEECDCLNSTGKDLISKITNLFSNLEDVVPIICTSNELEEDNSMKNSYNLYFTPLTKDDINKTYQRIKKQEKWSIDEKDEELFLNCMFDKLDTDLRQWLIHLENIHYCLNTVNKKFDLEKFYNYWKSIEKKNKHYTDYQIVEKLYRREFTLQDIFLLSTGEVNEILPMMSYTNLLQYHSKLDITSNKFITNFLNVRKTISEKYIDYEILRNYRKNFSEHIHIYSIIYSLGHILNLFFNRRCVYVENTEIEFPSIIYNKKYTECTHRKMINTYTNKYDINYEHLKFWSYYLYLLYYHYENCQNSQNDDNILKQYFEMFGYPIDNEDIHEIFKCDFLREPIKKRKKDNIIQTITEKLSIKIIDKNISNKKTRGRPKKKL